MSYQTESHHRALFEPFTIKKLALPNRIVMAPMTRSFAVNGVPVPETVEYYRRRAEGGVGFIITEGVGIERIGSRNDKGVPNFFGEESLAIWKQVADAVHAFGSKIAAQLWHVGSTPDPRYPGWIPDSDIDSPSGITVNGDKIGSPMTEEAIQDTIAAFARAAENAKRIGFDAVELHGAHGYLIDEFFWDKTNLRTDKWGGKTLRERTRFAVEVIKAVRQAVGPDFPIIIRVSQWKAYNYDAKVAKSPEELLEWITPLIEAGVDAIHGSQRRYWEPAFKDISDLNFAGWVKKLTGIPTITVGSVFMTKEFITNIDAKPTRIATLDGLTGLGSDFDLIAVGRALIGDSQWPNKIRENRAEEVREFTKEDLATLV